MPKTLEKTRKHIAKKRNGTVEALHQYSRDSRRLHRAALRDDKLEKLASSRSKKNQPLFERATYFQEALREKGDGPLELSVLQEIIEKYVHQYDEEFDEAKKARRPGRPPTARQDLLEMTMKSLKEEQAKGFFAPDLTTEENALALARWEGSWAYLSSVSWVRVSSDNTVRPSSFPPA